MMKTTGQLIYPGAAYKPLGPQTERLMSAHDIVCIHTMDGYLTSTDTYFRQGGYTGVESHFGIGGVWGSDARDGFDGAVWQWQDLMHVADANLNGNDYVISIEHADNAPPRDEQIARFSAAQVAADLDLIRWLCDKATHANCPSSWECHRVGIPMQLVPDSMPGRRGLAVHRQGIMHSQGYGVTGVAGVKWLVHGGVHWSDSIGKECPGDARVQQFVQEMIPALNAPSGEDWLTMATEEDVKNAVRGVFREAGFLSADIVPAGEFRTDLTSLNPQDTPRVVLAAARAAIDAKGDLRGDVTAQLDRIEQLLTSLTSTPAPPPAPPQAPSAAATQRPAEVRIEPAEGDGQ